MSNCSNPKAPSICGRLFIPDLPNVRGAVLIPNVCGTNEIHIPYCEPEPDCYDPATSSTVCDAKVCKGVVAC